ncbi:MAG: hypothetical protein C7B45_05380 [Sulfobacillus acidophilus]|uniref:Uncharacterized protein n=1 Tax=Sulfobacillus acidophilus TaxID=53633 RepID=A0A2T2WKL0_9FIRM|nr:MAG: hypothetical protein C7B45_05380 [Sulfobacillus acidophilus]
MYHNIKVHPMLTEGQQALASEIHRVVLGVFVVALFTLLMEWLLPKSVQTVQDETRPDPQTSDRDRIKENRP